MSKYIGQQCTSCRIEFTEKDDIVVCPECGSPYHRECYKNEGGCVNTFLHDGKGEWQPKEIKKTRREEKICHNCGNKNSPEAQTCTLCGIQLENPAEQPAEKKPWPDLSNDEFLSEMNDMMPPFLRISAIPPDTKLDENTAGEYASYVGPKFSDFIPKFQRFAKGKSKTSFNLSAFFFTYIWFFYRKMPIHGIITAAISIITALPTIIDYTVRLGGGYNAISDNPKFRAFSTLCSLLSWAMSLICGIFGDYMYYKKAKSDIASVKAEQPDLNRRSAEIRRLGGTSMGSVAVSFLVFMVVVSIIMAMFM